MPKIYNTCDSSVEGAPVRTQESSRQKKKNQMSSRWSYLNLETTQVRMSDGAARSKAVAADAVGYADNNWRCGASPLTTFA